MNHNNAIDTSTTMPTFTSISITSPIKRCFWPRKWPFMRKHNLPTIKTSTNMPTFTTSDPSRERCYWPNKLSFFEKRTPSDCLCDTLIARIWLKQVLMRHLWRSTFRAGQKVFLTLKRTFFFENVLHAITICGGNNFYYFL